jgi:hypothetical protein
MRRSTRGGIISRGASWLLGVVILTSAAGAELDIRQHSRAPCAAAGPLVRVPQLPEASGIAASGRNAGRLWAHNDSSEPALTALNGQGAVTGRVRLTGAAIEDWEAIAVGPCGAGTCVYIGDIGDNNASRKYVDVYRVPEPAGPSGSVALTDVIHATYPDGPQDAETLLITPEGDLYIVSKGDTGPIALYKFPRDLRAGSTVRLERVGEPAAVKPDAASRVTDGAVSLDGRWTALRTGSTLMFYRSSELFAGRWTQAASIDLKPLHEPQGEGVALGPDGAVFLVGEGEGKRQPGTFARFTCAPGD